MQATDFIYDGLKLSDFGFMICTFDSSGTDTVTAGSNITFNSVKQHGGIYYAQTDTEYGECFTTTFDICKADYRTPGTDITFDEFRSLMRWLNRREFCTFSLIDNHDSSWNHVCFEGSFNIERINFAGRLIGLTLTFQSNRPFGIGETITATLNVTSSNQTYSLENKSDEIGALYPDTVIITCNGSGNLSIQNSLDDKTVYIANCAAGEVITMQCMSKIITSSIDSHKLYNDFNFNFFRLYSTYSDRENKYTASIPCEIKVSYRPVIKVVF